SHPYSVRIPLAYRQYCHRTAATCQQARVLPHLRSIGRSVPVSTIYPKWPVIKHWSLIGFSEIASKRYLLSLGITALIAVVFNRIISAFLFFQLRIFSRRRYCRFLCMCYLMGRAESCRKYFYTLRSSFPICITACPLMQIHNLFGAIQNRYTQDILQ